VRNLVPIHRASASVSLVNCNTSYCALSLISLELFFRVALPRLSPPCVFRGSCQDLKMASGNIADLTPHARQDPSVLRTMSFQEGEDDEDWHARTSYEMQ
jgi:hypothetical protein